MAESKKIKVSGGVISDVAKPGKSAPSASSKPIIVTNRPVLKDPMMTPGEAKDEPSSGDSAPASPSQKLKIEPITKSEADTDAEKGKAPDVTPDVPEVEETATSAVNEPQESEQEANADATEQKEADQSDSTETSDDAEPDEAKKKKSDELDEATLKKEAERATELEKLIASRKYYLPINQLEKRRSKHYMIFGVIFIIILGLAWADVALDAGIITIHGVKAPTHFFK